MSRLKYDLIGKRFGRLVVITRAENYRSPSGDTAPHWNCICDCGNKTSVASRNLVHKRTQSCGCYKLEINTKHGKAHDKEYMREIKRAYRSTIDGHCKKIMCRIREKTKNTDLTFKYLAELWNNQKGFCAITGKPMDLIKGNGRKPNSPSVDRIDNDRGYFKDNVRWVCWHVNTMKGIFTDDVLDEWCVAVVQGLRNQKIEYIPNLNTFADIIDRMIIDIHKLAYWENLKRQEQAKENPDTELIAKADNMSRDCCEIRSVLKTELNTVLSTIVNSRAYYPVKEVRTFTPAAEKIAELLADVSFESAMKTFKPEFIEAMQELLAPLDGESNNE